MEFSLSQVFYSSLLPTLSEKEITVVFANIEDTLLTNTVRSVRYDPIFSFLKKYFICRLSLAPLKTGKRNVDCISIKLATFC